MKHWVDVKELGTWVPDICMKSGTDETSDNEQSEFGDEDEQEDSNSDDGHLEWNMLMTVRKVKF